MLRIGFESIIQNGFMSRASLSKNTCTFKYFESRDFWKIEKMIFRKNSYFTESRIQIILEIWKKKTGEE